MVYKSPPAPLPLPSAQPQQRIADSPVGLYMGGVNLDPHHNPYPHPNPHRHPSHGPPGDVAYPYEAWDVAGASAEGAAAGYRQGASHTGVVTSSLPGKEAAASANTKGEGSFNGC